MAARKYLGNQPAGTWDFMGLDASVPSKEIRPIQSPRTKFGQSAYTTLASRNPSGVGNKRLASHGHASVSDATSGTPPKKIKLERTSEERIPAPKYRGFIDLTGDSSDEEPATKPGSKETTRKATPTALTEHEAKSRQMRSEPNCANEDKMVGVIQAPAPVPRANVTSQPFSSGESSTDDDNKPFIAETPRAPSKKVIKTGPFNCDDSDESHEESTQEPASGRPISMPQRSSPTPSRTHVPNDKVAEEKAAQLRHAAELRSIAEAKKAARLAEEAQNATKSSAVSNAQRPTPHSVLNSMTVPSGQTPSSPAQKRPGAFSSIVGRRVEPGRPSSAKINTSSIPEHRLSEVQRARDHSLNGTLSATVTERALRAPSVIVDPISSVGTSPRAENQSMSMLQRALNKKDAGPVTAASKLHTRISPPAKQKVSKTVSWNLSKDDAPFTQQPSIAAHAARTHVEKLRDRPSSFATCSKSNGSDGLSQAQNEELFGAGDSDAEEVTVAATTKPQLVIDLAAKEDSMERAEKHRAMHKALLADELSKAQKDEFRAAEQRRLIEVGKEEKRRLAQEAAVKKQREEDDRSRRATKLRLDRIAEEERLVEERRVKHAELQESIKRKHKEDQVLKRKALETRKAQVPRLSEQQERDKQERVRQKEENNAKMHASLAAEAEAEAALQQHNDSGELVLERDPTPSHNLQASQDVSSAQLGQGSKTQTGPFSLNSMKRTTSVLQNIAQSNIAKPISTEERMAQEKRGWASTKETSARENAANTPARNPQEKTSPFFTKSPASVAAKNQGFPGTSHEGQATSKARAHVRKLGTVVAVDAKLVQWRDRDNMEWSRIIAEYSRFTGRKLSESTIRKRYRQVQEAVNEAKVPLSQMLLVADGDEDARDQVNSILEAANSDLTPPRGPDKWSGPAGAGLTKRAPLSQQTTSSPLWQNPTFEFEEKPEDVHAVKPRSAPETLAAPKVAEVRTTTGGKCMHTVFELIGRQCFKDAGESSDDEVCHRSSAEEDDEEYEALDGYNAEDYQPYGFQVQRRELSTEDAQMGFPIENQEWMPCGDIFTSCEDANRAAMVEVTTIMPGGAFYANPEDGVSLQLLKDKSTNLQRLMVCQLTNPIHGVVQTTVKKIVRAPRARMPPPRPEELREELKERELWYIIQQITIEPLPSRTYNTLFDEIPMKRIEIEGDRDPYTDYDLTTKRAVQIFVDKTYKSELQSLDSRSEEKREKVEDFMAAILADKTFEGELLMSETMEGMAGIRAKYKVEEGSKITLGVWIEKGRLKGPLN